MISREFRFWQVPQNMITGHSGLAVTCLTSVWEDQGSNPTMGSCRFFIKTTTINNPGHRLHTLTAVPRSTQPFTFCGMVKWVSAFGLSNNNKGRLTAWVIWPELRVSGHLAPFHTHHMNRVNSRCDLPWWQYHTHYQPYYYYDYYFLYPR